jgi:hypothetical protein
MDSVVFTLFLRLTNDLLLRSIHKPYHPMDIKETFSDSLN